MPFDWKEYLALAGFVSNQHGSGFSDEATKRCAISRAYYAAYCHARNHAHAKLGYIMLRSGQDHRGVREHYQSKGMNVIANKLGTLNQWRNNADYDEELIDNPNLLASTFSYATHIVSTLK